MNTKVLLTLHFVRHGLTRWNSSQRCLGRENIPLCSEGIFAVKNLAKYIDFQNIDTVYSSPSLRTIQTTELLLDGKTVLVNLHNDLQEIDFGLWEGVRMDEIPHKRKEEWAAWLADPINAAPYRGESLGEAKIRAKRLISEILQEYPGGNVLLVSHGAFMNVLLSYIMKTPVNILWGYRFSPASYSKVMICNYGPTISFLNFTSNHMPGKDSFVDICVDRDTHLYCSLPESVPVSM